MGIASAIAIGAVSGLRSMTGPAVVAEAASRNMMRLNRTPLKWLSSDAAARTFALLAVGELIADKLPSTPDRTAKGPLIARAISGAVCGLAMASHGTGFLRRRGKDRLIYGALAGAAGALIASYAGVQYRRATSNHPVAAAMLEDLAAVSLGAATVCTLSDCA